MSFVEKLRQEEAVRKQLLSAQQETQERERLQREVAEREYRARRRKQAEEFYQESAVGVAVNELIEFLETPTIPIEVYETRDGFTEQKTKYIGRGRGGYPSTPVELPGYLNLQPQLPALNQRDPDSVLDTVHWDHNTPQVVMAILNALIDILQ